MSEEIKREEQAPVSVLDLLLRSHLPDVRKELPERRVKVKRLSRLTGTDVVFILRGLPYGRVQELRRLREDVECHILLEGCEEPDLKSAALREKYGGATPIDAIQAMLLPGEIEDLSRTVEQLSGYRGNTIETVKNGSGRAATRS